MKSDAYQKTTKKDEGFLITQYFSRRFAYPVVVLCHKLGISANAVTVAGGVMWVVGAALTPLAAVPFLRGNPALGWWMLVTAAILWNLGCVMDVADGGLARLTGTSSVAGNYLDFVFHLVFNPMFLCSVGVFLYVITSHIIYLPVAIISIVSNWGPSHAAKGHILCEMVANGKIRPQDLPDKTRQALFSESIGSRADSASKRSALTVIKQLAKEYICFPGQFTLFSVAILADLLLRPLAGDRFYVLSVTFWVVTGIMTLRVPSRIAREFTTLKRFEDNS